MKKTTAKDYITTEPPKKAAQTNKKQTKEARFPWRVAFVGLVLLICLILLINKLSNDPEPTQEEIVETVEVVETKPVASQKKEGVEIPPAPEEQWQYVDSLVNREVEVEAKDISVPAIPYIMQCGAYKTHELADGRRARIALQGIKSKVVKSKNSQWYRVILGPYTFQRDAVKEQHVLQRVKIEPCIIMRQNAI